MEWRVGVIAVVGLIFSGMTGCCHCLKEAPPPISGLPAPISAEQQIAELNARAAALPRFKAKADQSGVEAILPDETGKPTRQPSGEGTLLLEQVYASHGAKLRLVVRYLDRDIFELGRNERVWWAVQRTEKPEAWTGPARRGSVGEADERSPAGLFESLSEAIPELLGITEIAPGAGESVVMRVDDKKGVNDLLIVRPAPSGGDGVSVIEREIVVDRRTGDVKEVDLYLPNGELLARAQLKDYQPVTYSGEEMGAGQAAPKMPRSVELDYPARRSQLLLRLASVEVPAGFREEQFDAPDWGDEGIAPRMVGR